MFKCNLIHVLLFDILSSPPIAESLKMVNEIYGSADQWNLIIVDIDLTSH